MLLMIEYINFYVWIIFVFFSIFLCFLHWQAIDPRSKQNTFVNVLDIQNISEAIFPFDNVLKVIIV